MVETLFTFHQVRKTYDRPSTLRERESILPVSQFRFLLINYVQLHWKACNEKKIKIQQKKTSQKPVLSVFIFLRAPGGDLARANLKCEGAKSKIQSATLYHPIFMSFLDLLDQKIEKFWKCFSKISLFLSKISDFSPFSHKRHKCLRAPGATSSFSGATPRSESAKMAPKRQYWQHWFWQLAHARFRTESRPGEVVVEAKPARRSSSWSDLEVPFSTLKTRKKIKLIFSNDFKSVPFLCFFCIYL